MREIATINNHNHNQYKDKDNTMTRDDNKDKGKGQVMTRRTTRKERKACTYVRQSWEQRGNTRDINNHTTWDDNNDKRCNKDKGKEDNYTRLLIIRHDVFL
jgi:hypothetical protein